MMKRRNGKKMIMLVKVMMMMLMITMMSVRYSRVASSCGVSVGYGGHDHAM